VDDLLLPIQHQVNGANHMEQNMRGNEEMLDYCYVAAVKQLENQRNELATTCCFLLQDLHGT
jgi:hypothetical protein